MAKKNYEEMSKQILEFVGGKDNVALFTHCATRLRFNVKDKGLTKVEELEKVPGVLGKQWIGEQLQIIIGQDVDDVYNSICNISGIHVEEKIDENLDDIKGKKTIKSILKETLNYLSSSAYGLLSIAIAGAMISTLNVVLGPDLLNILTVDSNLYYLFNLISQTYSYFVPVYIGYICAKSFKIEPLLGMFTGALLIVPEFTNLIGVKETISVYGIQAPVQSYTSNMLPTVLAVAILSIIYKFLRKIIPNSLQLMFVPLVCMLVMPPIVYGLCGPISSWVGNLLGGLFYFLQNSNIILRIVGLALLGGIMPFATLFGMHMPLYGIAYFNIMGMGYDSFCLVIAQTYSFVIYGMALGALIKYKNKKDKAEALTYFGSGLIGGVSEPILFGLCMKNTWNMGLLAIAGAVGGIVGGIILPKVYTITVINVFTMASVFAQGGANNMVKGLILDAICFVIGVVTILLFGKLDEESKSRIKIGGTK